MYKKDLVYLTKKIHLCPRSYEGCYNPKQYVCILQSSFFWSWVYIHTKKVPQTASFLICFGFLAQKCILGFGFTLQLKETVDGVPWLFLIFGNIKLFFFFWSLWMTIELMFLIVDVQHNRNRNARIHCMFADHIHSWL